MSACDLCGSTAATTLYRSRFDRSMLSDRRVFNEPLVKVECLTCGLVRTEDALHSNPNAFYRDSYATAVEDHVFYTRDGTVLRSAVFADWITDVAGRERIAAAATALEIGAGGGFLLNQLQQRMPATTFEGIEPGAAATAHAHAEGLPVHQAVLDDWTGGPYDLIYSVAVIEHVPSPTAFLLKARSLLNPGGRLILSQPIQDVLTYDLLFADHLYHFHSGHIAAYAAKTGFHHETTVVGHPLMPNFGLHILQAAPLPKVSGWNDRPILTTCRATAQQVDTYFARLDTLLGELASRNAAVAAFGLQEAFWVARIYSTLFDFPLTCGLDDQPNRPEYARLGFPVVVPEAAKDHGITEALLTMNRIYYDQAEQRLAGLGIRAHRVYS